MIKEGDLYIAVSPRWAAALLGYVLAAIIIAVIVYGDILENYTSRAEKDATIRTWFAGNPQPEYARYKKEVPKSDIVEYLDAKQKYGGN